MEDLHYDWLQILKDSYQKAQELHDDPPVSHLDFLGNSVFCFTTYDSSMSALFALQAIEVCKVIQRNSRKALGENDEPPLSYDYQWYLIMVNMPFFKGRLEWGTSICYAWWDPPSITLYFSDLWQGDEQLNRDIDFTRNEWMSFIDACIEFAEC